MDRYYAPPKNKFPHTPDDLKAIKSIVSKSTGISEKDMEGKARKKGIVIARQIYCYLAHKYTHNSGANIAKLINYRDHSMVIHSINTLNDLTDAGYEDIIDLLKKVEEDVSRIYTVKKKRYEFAT